MLSKTSAKEILSRYISKKSFERGFFFFSLLKKKKLLFISHIRNFDLIFNGREEFKSSVVMDLYRF